MRADTALHSGRPLIVHQGALGDFLLALPVFEGLHRLYPETLIDFCSRPDYTSILQIKPYYGRAHSFDASSLALLYHDELWRSTRVATYFLEARSIFLFGQNSSRLLASRLSQLVNCELYWLRSFPVAGQNRPVTQFLFNQLREQGLDLECAVPKIDPLPGEKEAVQDWMASVGLDQKPKPIIIHPGSGGRKKIWPLSRWWSLLAWLCTKYDHPVFMVLGEADQHLGPFATAAQKIGVYLLENISLQRLTAFLDRSQLYVGNDSGVSHLAAAVGVPTAAIFGSTLPEVWAPQGAEVYIIKSQWNEPENLLWSMNSGMPEFDKEVRAVVERVLG